MGKKHHEASIGASSEWRTPKYLPDQIGLMFDLDPAYPISGVCHIPTKRYFTEIDHGLKQPWDGLVWLNPPFGKRHGQVPWLRKFFAHGNGIALCNGLVSADWFHALVARHAELICFTRGKVKFLQPDGTIGGEPTFGTALIGMGEIACNALRKSNLGLCVVPDRTVRQITRRRSAVRQSLRCPFTEDLFAKL
jgi:DNA N-6-adenine-methyltransferase (Dam)